LTTVLRGQRFALFVRGAATLALAAALLTTGAEASKGAAATSMGAAEMRAMNFELRDQFGKALAYSFPKERISVLTFGDRKGSEQIEGWVKSVFDRYGDRIDLHGIAVLTSIPAPFHGLARRQFRQKIKYPVLLDFKGDVSKVYGYEKDRANIYVMDRDGRIRLKLTGAATPDGLNRVYAAVDQLLVA
jgi:peroxiredoxin